ncbi:MAG: type VII toxin-antitoxin system HepT family RNase toxin [Thermodesulfovibrionales bacterium]
MKRLEKALQILQQSSKVTFKELMDNEVLLSAVERNLHIAIECVLDIGNHIIAEKGFETPEVNEDIIRILGDEGVISSEFADRIKGMTGFRNILVHEYTGLDYGLLYNYLVNRLDDLREFAYHISVYLEKEKI